jgi:Fe2+ or Zn2+ uptake regulation protein
MDKQKRNTKTKQMIMEVLSNSLSALCHEDIERLLAEKMDRVTIYRILQGFCEDGKIHKISGENGKMYYALCHCCSAGNHSDNHLHFRCIKCETVLCIDDPIVTPELSRGYSTSNIACLILGYCPNCQPRAGS